MSVMAMDSTFKGDHVLMHLYLCLEMAMKTGVSCLCRGEGLSVRYEGHAKRSDSGVRNTTVVPKRQSCPLRPLRVLKFGGLALVENVKLGLRWRPCGFDDGWLNGKA